MFLGIDSDDDSAFESSDAAVLPLTDCLESSNADLLQSSMECQDVGTIAEASLPDTSVLAEPMARLQAQNSDDEDEGLTNDEIVEQALTNARHMAEVEIEPTPCDSAEKKSILNLNFMEKGCGCQLWEKQQCYLQFSSSHYSSQRSQCASLSKDELDMLILGQLAALSHFELNPKYSLLTPKRVHTTYYHLRKQVCRTTFLFLHGIGRTRLENLMLHFQNHGLAPRLHGNVKHLPHNALSFSSVETVVRFLVNFAATNAILLPGRIPGYRNTDVKLLPSSLSKRRIWRLYSDSAESAGDVKSVAYSTFNKLWKSLVPSITIMKPMSDLCWTCQQNSTSILRAANRPVLEKRMLKIIFFWFS